MSSIESNSILNFLNNTMYSNESIEMYDILISIPKNQTSIDLSDLTDKFVRNAECHYEYNYSINNDIQEGEVCASEYVSYTISHMLLVKGLFPNINIKASNKFHNYVSNNWWSRNNEEIYKIFNKNN